MLGQAGIHEPALAPAIGRQQRIQAGAGPAHLADAGDVEDVGHHGRGGGACSCARPVEHHPAHRVALHQDRVVHAMHAGQGVFLGQQRGIHPHIQLHRAVRIGAQELGRRHQFHHIAQLGCVVHIAGLELVDALGGDGGPFDRTAVGQAREDGDLVGGIAALHVGGGVGLGVAQLLGIGQHRLVGRTLIGHAAEDVVGGSVDDAAHPLDAVATQGLLEGFDDRNATAHGGFDQHVHALGGGRGGDLLAIAGNHGLVGRHHRFTGGNRPQNQATGRLEAAHHLHHDVHGRVVHHRFGVGGEEFGRQLHRPGAAEISHRHPPQGQVAHQRMAPLRAGHDAGHAGAHSAEPEQADADGHACVSVKAAILEI